MSISIGPHVHIGPHFSFPSFMRLYCIGSETELFTSHEFTIEENYADN